MNNRQGYKNYISSVDEIDDPHNIKYKVLNSEEEYSENERVLKNVCDNNYPGSYDSETEVMKFNNEDEDEKVTDSMISDIEGLEEDFNLPNEKAWGKKKKAYYSTDYIDADYSSTSIKEIDDAKLEEEEARNLQTQLAGQLDEADFGLDLVLQRKSKTELDKNNEHVEADLSKLSKRQKQELLNKDSPEFVHLLIDFQDRLTELRTILRPFLEFVERSNCQNCSAINSIKAKYEMQLHYCLNIIFYLMLKSKKESAALHPVIKRLSQYKQLITEFEDRQQYFLNKIEIILKSLYSSINFREIIIREGKQKTKDLSVPLKSKQSTVHEKLNENEVVFQDDLCIDKGKNYQIDQQIIENIDNGKNNKNGEIETEKRAITYQIAKNKGLMPHRKKDQRNPRVKHRNKYRKAKIRRRGAVREVRKEINRYEGEISGIKASIKKSIKFK